MTISNSDLTKILKTLAEDYGNSCSIAEIVEDIECNGCGVRIYDGDVFMTDEMGVE